MAVVPRLMQCFGISLSVFIKTHSCFCLKIKDYLPQSNIRLLLFIFSGQEIQILKCLFNFFSQRNSHSACPKFKSCAPFPSSPLCSDEEQHHHQDSYSRLTSHRCLPPRRPQPPLIYDCSPGSWIVSVQY